MSTLVVDASIAFSWTVETPQSAKCVDILRSAKALIAPDLIVPELTNAFTMQIRAGTADPQRIKDGLEFLPRWFTELVPSTTLRNKALDLALELNHPAYDCFYLALALDRSIPFITLDREFLQKAISAGHKRHISHLEQWKASRKP